MLDVTSPMWVRGDTLFIPSVFAQYNNSWEADPVQDEKTPLLRSMVRRPIGSSLAPLSHTHSVTPGPLSHSAHATLFSLDCVRCASLSLCVWRW